MKARDIRKMTTEELVGRLNEHQQELFNLRFQHSTRQLSNTSRPPMVKREIARVRTVLRERELAEAMGS